MVQTPRSEVTMAPENRRSNEQGRCPERRCDLRLSIINTLRCPCLDGKSFLDPVVGQGTHQLRDLPIAFEATEFAFRQQQRGASPAFAMVPCLQRFTLRHS